MLSNTSQSHHESLGPIFIIGDYNFGVVKDLVERDTKELRIPSWKSIARTMNSGRHTFEQFTLSLVDFAFPAITAIGFQIAMFLQYALLHPNVIKKMQAEMDNVVGSGRLPCLDDRQNLHFCEATVREILRIETLVATDVPHVALVDTKLAGYNIPEGTVVIPTLTAFHDDEQIWGDPRNFRPERFLDDQGRMCLKKDFSLPFGAGKRLCAGETFARNMLFLMITALAQQFDFFLDKEQPFPLPEKNDCGIVVTAPDFWISVKCR
uniref:Cytochrome P450 n=1 Tax=Megaselia scalaris TaxID=36166 RepID=T1GV35_MEGSC